MTTKERIGVVVSNKMQKTIVVAVENRAPSRKYGKTVVTTKRYKVHDENNDCHEGDRVRIRETRPLSKTKRWSVAAILESASGQAPPQPLTSEPTSPDQAIASGEPEPAPSQPLTSEPEQQS